MYSMTLDTVVLVLCTYGDIKHHKSRKLVLEDIATRQGLTKNVVQRWFCLYNSFSKKVIN